MHVLQLNPHRILFIWSWGTIQRQILNNYCTTCICTVHSNYGQLRMQLQSGHIIQYILLVLITGKVFLFLEYSILSSLYSFCLSTQCFQHYFQKLNFRVSGHNIFIFRGSGGKKKNHFELNECLWEHVYKHFNKAKAYSYELRNREFIKSTIFLEDR